jgi:hypothetical protein
MSAVKKCGLKQVSIFSTALISGTACSIAAKIMLDMKSIGMTGQVETFSNPLFQTFGMFLGMLFSLIIHIVVVRFRIKFPGYDFNDSNQDGEKPTDLPLWMYFYLLIPATFDLVSTGFSMYGLMYINVSVYQMLRGGAIIFVAILKEFYLGHKLSKYMWVGIFWNVVAIILVGMTAMLTPVATSTDDNSGDVENNPLLGIILVLMGAFVGALQYAFEEQVMNMDIAAPPLLLVGMEGLWGSLICIFIIYPLAYIIPGSDHGSFENPYNTYALFSNSSALQSVFLIYFVAVFMYNMFGILVTFTMNSVWRAILDNFRPISVWGTDLFIYYFISSSFGEEWTQWSYLQLVGLAILIYGIAIYNAPNPGSLKLTGTEIYSCGLNFSDEYIDADENEDEFGSVSGIGVVSSPYLSNISPFLTPSRRNTSAMTPQARTRLLAMTTTPNLPAKLTTYSGYPQKDTKEFTVMKKQNSFA